MEKSIINIQLEKRPLVCSCNGKQTSSNDQLGYRSEGFMIINSFSLVIPLGYQPCFVMLNTSISIILDFVYPFPSNSMFSRWQRCENLSVIWFKCTYVYSHGISPASIFDGRRKISWFMISRYKSKEGSITIRKFVIRNILRKWVVYTCVRTIGRRMTFCGWRNNLAASVVSEPTGWMVCLCRISLWNWCIVSGRLGDGRRWLNWS